MRIQVKSDRDIFFLFQRFSNRISVEYYYLTFTTLWAHLADD